MDKRIYDPAAAASLSQRSSLRADPAQRGPDSEYAEFQNEYRLALMDFLTGRADEAALVHAYELGRRGATSQLSILNLTDIHQAALAAPEFRQQVSLNADAIAILAKGAEFLGQALAPFEMMHSGYVDTITQLQKLNATLNQQSEALRQREERMRLFIKHNPAAVAMLDRNMRYVLASPRWNIDYRLGEMDLIGRSHYEIFPEISQEWRAIHQRCLGGATYKRDEDPFVRADGSVDWVRWEIHPWYTDNGEVGGIIIFSEVITERKNQERKIARLSRIQGIMSAINAAIVRTNNREQLLQEVCRVAVEHGRFRLAWVSMAQSASDRNTVTAWGRARDNGVARAETGDVFEERAYASRALKHRRPSVCNDIANSRRLQHKDAYLARGYRSFVVLPLCEADKPVGILSLYASEPDFFDREEMKLLSELAEDISFALNHIVKEEQINYLAYYDVLTGLPNRDLFFDRLQRQIEVALHEDQTIAVLVVDLERFSSINDSFGRHVGDAVLKQTAERLKSSISSHDSVAHIGADVFAIMLGDIKSAAHAAHVLERMLAQCFTPVFQTGEQELYAAAKVGIALFPGDGADHDTLYKNAEIALKKAQKNGETYLFYRREMNASVARRLTLENRLYRALERGEFTLYYQPKFHTVTNRMVGMESLLRWQEPEAGLVLPSAFIPILEETGMILPVGEWIMERALDDHARWTALGLNPPPVAVNVSVVQLRHRNFVDSLKSIGKRIPAGGHALDLEITESILMEGVEQNIAKLRAAKDMGMKIAIDDFGTGYSSLSYLTRLPIDLLKIDRSFVLDMNQSPSGLAIVSSVISLAHSLQLDVIAEGVDDEEQAKLLKLLRCDQLQGFYCSVPVTGKRIEEMLAEAA